MLREELARRPDALQILRREAHQAQSLSHPGIVNVFDFDHDGDVYFITMEYVEGTSLKQLIKSRGKLPIAVALSVGKQLARALEVAHAGE